MNLPNRGIAVFYFPFSRDVYKFLREDGFPIKGVQEHSAGADACSRKTKNKYPPKRNIGSRVREWKAVLRRGGYREVDVRWK